MTKISEHVAYSEVIRSDTAKRKGIKNNPSDIQLERIKLFAEKVFEPLRNYVGVPIFISSCFRSKALNKALGGATSSQHMANNGAAMDLDADIFKGVTNKEIFDYIKDNLDFDQLIIENVGKDGTGGWIHVSYKEFNNRKEVLRMTIKNGKSTYTKYQ